MKAGELLSAEQRASVVGYVEMLARLYGWPADRALLTVKALVHLGLDTMRFHRRVRDTVKIVHSERGQ